MRAVVLMFDSLNRCHLPPYGCGWTHAPNFQRLAQRTVTFDHSYVCSMPCMPARRDFHTGRPNFLHRSWGPLEPFDDSVPRMLKQSGVYTHLTSDHYHYWETGGATYHCQYNTWDFHRGQEGDPWIGQVKDPPVPECVGQRGGERWRQDWVHRQFFRSDADMPQTRTIRSGIDFIRRNADQDRWLLQIETFDPHEPFFSQRQYKDLYREHYERYRGKHFDWPPYDFVKQTREEVEHMRHEYAALLSMCDARLGDVLDVFDELNLWDDTMLVVWTDHGFLLGEHECWAKVWMPFYEEVAHTPFFVWDPRSRKRGERRQALVQPAIDLGPTLLSYFGVDRTADMLGKDLAGSIAGDQSVRDAAIFGLFGGHVNATDGRYVYMRGPASQDNVPLFQYTLMPTHMAAMFSPAELAEIELSEPLSFTKGCRVMKIPGRPRGVGRHPDNHRTLLYDVEADPRQERPINDPAVEQRLIGQMMDLMRACDAPAEQYERLGLPAARLAFSPSI